MDINRQRRSPGLAKGQLWKTEDAYLEIVELETRLIHYKLMRRPDQPAATRLIKTDVLAVYLRAAEATLMN
jgi:hypothetical protein